MLQETMIAIVITLVAPAIAGGVAVRPATNWTKKLLSLSGKRFQVGELVVEWVNLLALFYSFLSALILAAVEVNLLDTAIVTPEIVTVMIGATFLSAKGFYAAWKKADETN